MQNLNSNNHNKTNYNHKAYVEGTTVRRIVPTPYTVPAQVYYHPQYTEWSGKNDNNKQNKKSQHAKHSGGFNINKILDFVSSEEALILSVVIILIIEENTDFLLIIVLGYLLLFV